MDFSLNNEALRRTLLLATALVLALVVVGRTIGDYRAAAVREMRDVYEMRELEYRKYARLLDNKERYLLLQAELDKAEQGIAGSRFFTAKTTSLAEVRFQERIDSLATESGLTINSRKVLKAVEIGDLKELRVAVSSRAEIGALNDFLGGLGGQGAAMFVESMEIKRFGDPTDRFLTFNAVLKAYAL
jgi:hypothetical protein